MTRRDPFANTDGNVEDLIPASRSRPRRWEAVNPATSYRIPPALREAASNLRENLAAIAQATGDWTTQDEVAEVFLCRALEQYKLNPAILPTTAAPNSRTGQTLVAEETWAATPPDIPLLKRKAKVANPRTVLALRIKSETAAAVKTLAKTVCLPVGETALALLLLSLAEYKNGKFRLSIKPKIILRAGSGWENEP